MSRLLANAPPKNKAGCPRFTASSSTGSRKSRAVATVQRGHTKIIHALCKENRIFTREVHHDRHGTLRPRHGPWRRSHGYFFPSTRRCWSSKSRSRHHLDFRRSQNQNLLSGLWHKTTRKKGSCAGASDTSGTSFFAPRYNSIIRVSLYFAGISRAQQDYLKHPSCKWACFRFRARYMFTVPSHSRYCQPRSVTVLPWLRIV